MAAINKLLFCFVVLSLFIAFVATAQESPSVRISVKVSCRRKTGLATIKGATVKAICKVIGSPTPLRLISPKSNRFGIIDFHFAKSVTLANNKTAKIQSCKISLNTSPLPRCNVPTNINHGITGTLVLVAKQRFPTVTLLPGFVFSSRSAKPIIIPS